MHIKSHVGASYFITIIHDESRKVWVYVLKSNNQVFEVFKDFHAKVERKIGKLLKCHMDNDGEYTSKMFKEY